MLNALITWCIETLCLGITTELVQSHEPKSNHLPFSPWPSSSLNEQTDCEGTPALVALGTGTEAGGMHAWNTISPRRLPTTRHESRVHRALLTHSKTCITQPLDFLCNTFSSTIIIFIIASSCSSSSPLKLEVRLHCQQLMRLCADAC